MENRLAELEQRLAGAERRERTLRRQFRALFGLILTVVVGAVTLVAAKPGLTQSDGYSVTAPFKVVDSNGKTLFQVESTNDGALLSLFDQNGNANVQLSTNANGGDLGMNSSLQGAFVDLSVDENGGNLTLRGDNNFTAP